MQKDFAQTQEFEEVVRTYRPRVFRFALASLRDREAAESLTVTIPAGAFGNDREVKVVSERWYSDDLQALVKSSNVDPRFGTTTYELTNIVQASPDPALFQAPADYTPRNPNQ